MMFAALLLSPALTKLLNSAKNGRNIAGQRESFGSRQVQSEALCIGQIIRHGGLGESRVLMNYFTKTLFNQFLLGYGKD